MSQRFSSLRVLAVLVGVVAVFAVVGVVLASANAFTIDNFTTGGQAIAQTPPNTSSVTMVSTSVASASGALGLWRTTVFTTAFLANSDGKYSTYNVNIGSRTLGISAPSGGTPGAFIKWDGTNDPNVVSTSGLGSVDLISGTNTGFVIEFKQEDLPAQLGIRVYSGANTSVYTISMPGGVNAGSHVDYFVPFSNFTAEEGSLVNFASVGAITWKLVGVDSLDFEVTNYETDNVQDFGDLPDTYGTLLTSNGPRHDVTFTRLGNNVDSEATGVPSANALGDDNDGNAVYLPGDEDGVARGSRLFAGDAFPVAYWRPGAVLSGLGGSVSVVVNGPCTSGNPCHLRGWVDWNANGVLESSEVIITGTGTWNGEFTAPVPSGISKYFDIPSSPACFGSTCYARFRICGGTGGTVASDCDSPNGPSISGEVEDYAWNFGPLAVTLNNLEAKTDTQNNTAALILAATVVAALGLAGVALRRRTA